MKFNVIDRPTLASSEAAVSQGNRHFLSLAHEGRTDLGLDVSPKDQTVTVFGDAAEVQVQAHRGRLAFITRPVRTINSQIEGVPVTKTVIPVRSGDVVVVTLKNCVKPQEQGIKTRRAVRINIL